MNNRWTKEYKLGFILIFLFYIFDVNGNSKYYLI